MSEFIVGSGGSSGGSSRAAVEDPNTLRSKSFAQGVDLLGEGEWEEVCVGALKGVYLDDTPVMTADGTLNYTGLSLETKAGTVDQSRLSVAGSTTESSTAVGVEMKYNQPVTVTVNGESIDFIRLVVAVNALYNTDTSTGDIHGTSVSYKIEYNSADNETWRTVPNSDSITQSPLSYGESTSYSGYNRYTATFTIFPAVWYVNNSSGGFERKAPCHYQYQVSTDSGSTWKTLASSTVSEDTTVTQAYETTTGITAKFRILVSTPASFAVSGTLLRDSYSAVSSFLGGKYAVNTGIQTIEGKTTTSYEREHAFRIYGTSPFGVRVTRQTADSTSSYLVNATVFQSITTVVEEKFTYPFSVLVGWSVDATQFSSIPTRAYKCKMLKVKVPSNYDSIARTYSGIWDGSFKIAWTDNPAWCWRDLVTNTRYGLGQRVKESMIDDAELYQIAKYCDEYVPNGSGGYEPRFTCNLLLQDQAQAWQVLADMASIFNGITYWNKGSIIPVQDSPKEVAYQFNNTNVINGEFSYAGSSRDSRYNAVYVTWNDPSDMYRQTVEFVSNDDLIASMGYLNSTSITAFGCTSRGQAVRAAKWYIYSNNLETESVSFVASLEGMIPKPGDIIRVSDTLRSTSRRGGRVVSVSGLNVVLDSTITFDLARQYTISVILADGTIEDRTFNHSGESSIISVDSAFSQDIAEGSVFIISDDDIPEKLFRVVSITDKGDWQFQVTGVAYNNTKYDNIERDEPLVNSVPAYSAVGDFKEVKVSETLYSDGVSVKTKMIVSWQAPKKATSYNLYFKAPDGTRQDAIGIKELSYELTDAQEGQYTIQITPFNVLGQDGTVYETTYTVLGKTADPSDITGLNLVANNGQGVLSWDTHPDLDVKVGGQIIVKYTDKTSNVYWEDGIIVAKVAGIATQAIVPLMSGTYTAKAVDDGGRYSRGFAFVNSSFAELQNTNVMATLVEQPAFSGAKTNCFVEDSMLTMVGIPTMYQVDAMYGVNSMYVLSDAQGKSGEYLFHDVIDLTDTYTVKIYGTMTGFATVVGDTINSRLTPVNTWTRWNGERVDTAELKLWISLTNDDPASSVAVWTDWQEFILGEYTARGFKFKTTMSVEKIDHILQVSKLEVSIDAVDRVLGEYNVAVNPTGYTVTYDGAFATNPAVAINIDGMQTGDYYEFTSRSASGFSIVVYDSSGTPVERQIDWIAKGYGRKV